MADERERLAERIVDRWAEEALVAPEARAGALELAKIALDFAALAPDEQERLAEVRDRLLAGESDAAMDMDPRPSQAVRAAWEAGVDAALDAVRPLLAPSGRDAACTCPNAIGSGPGGRTVVGGTYDPECPQHGGPFGRDTAAESGETVHDLKVWPQFFDALADDSKPFEVRRDDRGFQVGDLLRLNEWDPDTREHGRFVRRRVSYVLRGETAERFGVAPGYCVLGLTAPASGSAVPGEVTKADLRDALNACQRRQMEVLHQRDAEKARADAAEATVARVRELRRDLASAPTIVTVSRESVVRRLDAALADPQPGEAR